MDMFEKASRLKLRFDSIKGVSSVMVEDLWTLPLSGSAGQVNLDDIAIALRRKLRDNEDSSLVSDSKIDPVTQLKFDIVKHVIEVLKAEKEAAANAREAARKRQRILGIIAEREDEELRKLPLEDLRKAAAV